MLYCVHDDIESKLNTYRFTPSFSGSFPRSQIIFRVLIESAVTNS